MVRIVYVPQDAYSWRSKDEHCVLWTDNLNECMVFVIFTETHIGFYHLSSHNYLLNPKAKKGIAPGNNLVEQSRDRNFVSVRVYSNPPGVGIIKRKTLTAVISNFNLPLGTAFYHINWQPNAPLSYDTQTDQVARVKGTGFEEDGIETGNQRNFHPLVPVGGNDSCCVIL